MTNWICTGPSICTWSDQLLRLRLLNHIKFMSLSRSSRLMMELPISLPSFLQIWTTRPQASLLVLHLRRLPNLRSLDLQAWRTPAIPNCLHSNAWFGMATLRSETTSRFAIDMGLAFSSSCRLHCSLHLLFGSMMTASLNGPQAPNNWAGSSYPVA